MLSGKTVIARRIGFLPVSDACFALVALIYTLKLPPGQPHFPRGPASDVRPSFARV
jgi:hypothetical protein